MDRLDDVLKAVLIYSPEGIVSSTSNLIAVPFIKKATSVSRQLDENEQILQRMNKLITRKEFSNDPTEEIAELSSVFEKNVNSIQISVTSLTKSESTNYEISGQSRQHWKLILQQLRSRLSSQIQEFKDILKTHALHVNQRQQRVSRYGQSQTHDNFNGYINNNNNNNNMGRPSYAMYTSIPTSTNAEETNPILRRRPGLPVASTTNLHASHMSSSGLQESMITKRSYHQEENMKSAQKVEVAITQMGELFTKMSSLVMEQSETILRIEDDVEIGLENTAEAHGSMETVYLLTKGNRGVIIKVFCLLLLFIALFLIFT